MAGSTFLGDTEEFQLKERLRKMKTHATTICDLMKIQTFLLHSSPFPREPFINILKLDEINNFGDFFCFSENYQFISLRPTARNVLEIYFKDHDMARAEIKSLLSRLTEELIQLYRITPTQALLEHSRHLLDNHKDKIDDVAYAELKRNYELIVPVQVSDPPKHEEPVPIPTVAVATPVIKNEKKTLIRYRRIPPPNDTSGFWYGIGGLAVGAVCGILFMRNENNRNVVEQVTEIVARKLSS